MWISSFIYTKSKERVLIFQTVNENGCSIYIYKENKLSEEFHGSDPNSVWKKICILKEWFGVTLFGLDNSNVKEKLEQSRKLICFMKNGTIIPKWNKYSDITYKKGRVVKLIGIHCSGNGKKMIVK
jgi:hypothetical protein